MTDQGSTERWDAGVQNERTALAWQRTALALLGAIVVAARFGMRHWPVVTAAALTPALALALAMLHLAGRRYRQAQAAMRDEAPRPGGRLPLFAAASITLLGLAALAAVLAGIS